MNQEPQLDRPAEYPAAAQAQINNINENNNNVINQDAALVSGSDINGTHDDYDEDDSSDSSSSHHSPIQQDGSDTDDNDDIDGNQKNSRRKYDIPKRDNLYNPKIDDEDEAWVYKHMRGGVEEMVPFQHRHMSSSSTSTPATSTARKTSRERQQHPSYKKESSEPMNQLQNQQLYQAKLLKPRTSDAILSCPCCLQILCMDCQRHERYTNQFRAMFVMNIGVSWDKTIAPDQHRKIHQKQGTSCSGGGSGQNRRRNEQQQRKDEINTIPMDTEEISFSNNGTETADDEVYYSVHCVNCRTEVAALNMKDEIYHFFGCLASG